MDNRHKLKPIFTNPAKERAMNKRPSLRDSINNKCRECIYDNHVSGTWRQQVDRCTVKTCPIYDVRPRSSVKEEVITRFYH